jgi:Rieske Fe-S protein
MAGAGLLSLGWGVATLLAAGSVPRSPLKRLATGIKRGDLLRTRTAGSVALVPLGDGAVRALDRRCPHLGCLVVPRPDGSGFECPCHGSAFDRTGRRLSGPAREGLRALEITESPAGELEVILHDHR